MAEPLKNRFGPDVPPRIAAMVAAAYPAFDTAAFMAAALDGYNALELTPRARRIATTLHEYLPSDPEEALGILMEATGLTGEERLVGMESFLYMPFTYFVAEHGLGCFETSMRAQYELTQRFTAEFSIRAFLERHPARTLERLHLWSRDPSEHVRRLVSEGTRPRLPWATRLRRFQEDPSPVLGLLEALKDDPSEYVRRSVANNLNDISKDHPDVVLEVARRWWEGAGRDRRRLVRHGLRTMIKAGDPEALSVLGFGADTPAVVARAACTPTKVHIGERVHIEVDVENPSGDEVGVLVDLRIHFVKANGATRPKVFKGAELTLAPGAIGSVKKTVSVAQHSTRKHYAGAHRIDVMINGITHRGPDFEIS